MICTRPTNTPSLHDLYQATNTPSGNIISPNNTEDRERDQKDKEMVNDIVTSSVVTALVPIIQMTEKGTKKTRRW